MMHEDFDQLQVLLPNGNTVWVTFCTCGKAFWSTDSQKAYDAWEQHEADEY